jgi:hypothetical protein
MLGGARPRRLIALSALVLAVGGTAVTTGCRTTESDVHRWGTTLNGPRKLVAVLSHDKYPLELRVEAAVTLATMKARGGQHVGLQGGDEDDQPGMLATLQELDPATRERVIAALVPRLLTGMQQMPTVEGKEYRDLSVPYKDAAFALLAEVKENVISDPKIRAELRAAIATWTLTAFEKRLDDPSQAYGSEQVIRYLGAEGVRGLPDLMTTDSSKLARMASLVAELGDNATKSRAALRLVGIAKEISSVQWRDQKAALVRKANEDAKLQPTPKQFEEQVGQFQEDEVLRVFGNLRQVGTQPAVDYLLLFAQDKAHSEKQRAAALAALERNLATDSRPQIDAMTSLIRADDSPDGVRDQALRRLGEMSRKAVIGDLYGLFKVPKWRVRWMAAETTLKTSTTKDLAEFFEHLGKVDDLTLTEALRYGTLMGGLAGPPDPRAEASRLVARPTPISVRLMALGWYAEYGTTADVPAVSKFASDTATVSRCKRDGDGCEWKCSVTEGKQSVSKDVKTVGDFVNFCVLPGMSARPPKAAGGEKQTN